MIAPDMRHVGLCVHWSQRSILLSRVLQSLLSHSGLRHLNAVTIEGTKPPPQIPPAGSYFIFLVDLTSPRSIEISILNYK